MKYTVEELDEAKCEFVDKLKAAGSKRVDEYNGDDEFLTYYRHISAFVGESFVSVTLMHSPFRSGIVYWNDETDELKDLTLEEFRNIKL